MLRLNYDDEEEGNKLNLDVFAKDYEEDTAKCSSKLKSAYSKRIRKLEALLSNVNLSPTLREEYSLELGVLKDATSDAP